MKKPVLLFIINPISGDRDKQDLDNHIEDYCKQNNLDFSLLKTTGEDDPSRIKAAIKKLNPTITVACGGDGTVTMVADQLIGHSSLLAIFPLGSANGLAYELGIPEDWSENLDLLTKPNTITIDALRINGKHLSLHLSDVGFNAKLIREFEREGSRGKLAYAKSFFKMFVRRKPGRFQILIGEKATRVKAEMIVLANASSYGTGAVVNPRSDMSDGLFEVCVFKPFPWYKFIGLTWHSFVGHLENSPYYNIYQTDRVIIKSGRNQEVQVDGEVIGKMKELKAEIIKSALKIVIAAKT